MLARDAFDEFANAPYPDIIALKPHMDREQLIAWIKATDTVPASRRRLYLTMLGVCGEKEDANMLEGFMRSDDREEKLGLDAMVACYLTLLGPEGMGTVKELFLSNEDSEYSDTYSAIMALRFHASDEIDVIPRDQILSGFHCLLNRPELADLVIPDLARSEDWTVLPRMLELFENADAESNWIRVPIVNYVRACPLEESDELLEKLREIDPAAVKRASTFFPMAPKSNKPMETSQLDNFNQSSKTESDLVANVLAAPTPPPELTGTDADSAVAGNFDSSAYDAIGSIQVSERVSQDSTNSKLKWILPAVVGLAIFGAIGRILVGKVKSE